MGKWFGKVGFCIPEETEKDVWTDKVVECSYQGDLIKARYKNQSSDSINDNLLLSVRLRILADPFLNVNLPHIKYVSHLGARWKVTSIEEQYPSVILEIGDVYNGNGPQ